MTINVLITGAAGNLAHFIWKGLLHSNLPAGHDVRAIGCNYNHDGAGLYQFDVGYVVPAAVDPAYVPMIMEICRRESVHIIMIGNMTEMRILARHAGEIYKETGAFVVSSPSPALRLMEDKWELAMFLRQSGFGYPRSVLPSDRKSLEQFLDEVQFPYVVKSRFGAGSQHLATARTNNELEYLAAVVRDPVIQEYLTPDDEEYTVGVFVCSNGRAAASIVMKRQLNLGMTFKAQVLPESMLGAYCERILERIGCIGPANVQLRLTERGPVVFEINPRFSSTTSARPHYGFNETEMCIRHFVLKEEIVRPMIRGGRLFRVVEDVFVDEMEFDLLAKTGKIENSTKTILWDER